MIRASLRLLHATLYTLEMSRRCAVAYRRTGRREDGLHVVQAWVDRFGARFDVDVVSQGGDQVDWDRPHIVMANHQSYLDIFALCRALPRLYGMVAKGELARVPFFADVLEVVGCVVVDRANHQQAVHAMQRAADEVRGGKSILIFPEGTRSPRSVIGPFKKGGLHLALAARVPVVPVGIRGSATLMPRNNTALYPGTMDVRIGDPIAPTGDDTPEAREVLAARVRADLERLTGFGGSGGGA